MAESLQNLNRRLKGVQNIGQITKAMELVAATKMRRSQEIALASRPYVFAALDLLASTVRLTHITLPQLLTKREVKRTAYVVVTSDKGLAGSFNNAILREFEKYAKREKLSFEDEKNTFFGIGQKAAIFLDKKTKGRVTSFTRVGDYATVNEVLPIAETLINGFMSEKWDRVIAMSTHFRSALKQEVLIREILPTTFESLKKTAREIVPETGKFAELVKAHDIPLFRDNGIVETTPDKEAPEYIIEPSAETVLKNLAKHLVVMEIYHLVLEANASEHAARRMAMKSASDNARDLGDTLSIRYNKSRQAVITRELIEITAGAESLR